MNIINGRIIVTPSLELIAKCWGEGMSEKGLCDLFGFNRKYISMYLRKKLPLKEFKQLRNNRRLVYNKSKQKTIKIDEYG